MQPWKTGGAGRSRSEAWRLLSCRGGLRPGGACDCDAGRCRRASLWLWLCGRRGLALPSCLAWPLPRPPLFEGAAVSLPPSSTVTAVASGGCPWTLRQKATTGSWSPRQGGRAYFQWRRRRGAAAGPPCPPPPPPPPSSHAPPRRSARTAGRPRPPLTARASSTACCASSSSTSPSPPRVATAFVAPAWCGRWTTSRPAPCAGRLSTWPPPPPTPCRSRSPRRWRRYTRAARRLARPLPRPKRRPLPSTGRGQSHPCRSFCFP